MRRRRLLFDVSSRQVERSIADSERKVGRFVATEVALMSYNRVELLAAEVVLAHREWLEAHPDAYLTDLRSRLEEVVEQCRCLAENGDPVIDGCDEAPEPLASEVALWPNEATVEQAARRFSDRLFELELYLQHVTELERLLGPSYEVWKLLQS